MAELSKSGTYVKFIAHAWMDQTTGAIKVNSADKEIRSLGGIHFTGKQGSKTRETLVQLLENHGCGPKAAAEKVLVGLGLDNLENDIISGKFDEHLELIEELIEKRKSEA